MYLETTNFWVPEISVVQYQLRTKEFIGHFRVAVNLIMEARLSAKLFIWKLVLFAYE